ncbi:MAG: AprI/Inh family metalloprotease inhibitor [Pseudolabrys sp.]|nr:AprI/Inh family metalloprotease inhibitor [Pseudolabrys sp.]
MTSATPDKPSPTDVMDGRWILAAPNAPSCGLTFTAPSPSAGNTTPDGGCPERFYMSRRWRLADGTLTITDADDTALGTFRVNGDRFEGKSEAGTAITLSR